MNIKLIEIKTINGKVILKSGLHIGTGDLEMHVGGTDSAVVKHPHTNEPYIPGSSIKGKVRSLLELESGLIAQSKGRPLDAKLVSECRDNVPKAKGESILKLFGTSGSDGKAAEELGPTRSSFTDCYLNEDYKRRIREKRQPLTETKSENVINRITGVAEHPRTIERVPRGMIFDFSVTLKILAEGDEKLLVTLLRGLRLLQEDALGGSGSRGYGRVEFEFCDEKIQKQFIEIDLQKATENV